MFLYSFSIKQAHRGLVYSGKIQIQDVAWYITGFFMQLNIMVFLRRIGKRRFSKPLRSLEEPRMQPYVAIYIQAGAKEKTSLFEKLLKRAARLNN